MTPAIFASKINQLIIGGIDFIIVKIINRVRTALKVFVLIFLFNRSKFFIPENSILIICNPTIHKIKGSKKLTKFGKNDVMFIPKKELKNTSNIAMKNKNEPEYKYVLRF